MKVMADAANIQVEPEGLVQVRAALMETVLLSEHCDLFAEIAEAIPTEEGKIRFVSTGDAFELLQNMTLLKAMLSCVLSVKALHVARFDQLMHVMNDEMNHGAVMNPKVRLCAVRIVATVETAPIWISVVTTQPLKATRNYLLNKLSKASRSPLVPWRAQRTRARRPIRLLLQPPCLLEWRSPSQAQAQVQRHLRCQKPQECGGHR